MNWDSRAAAKLLPLSEEKENLGTTLKEWLYTGEMLDLEEATETCELCDRPNIRYQFLIGNFHNHNPLWIGSECITKFKRLAIDAAGKCKILAVDARQSKEKVRRELISDAKEKNVINSLIDLGRSDAEFKIDGLIEYYKTRKAFTPDQLVSLFLHLDKNKIEYEESNFRITIQRSEEQEQLRKMEEGKIEKIWKCMNPSQRNSYRKKFL